MKTDAQLLLELLGEECCCCCDEPAPVQTRAPARPGMQGRYAAPLTVLPPEEPFVPALYPERESPQLPLPGHQPALQGPAKLGEYYGLGAGPEKGFTQGVLLDSGRVIEDPPYRVVDHEERVARYGTGTLTSVDTANTPPGYVATTQDPPEAVVGPLGTIVRDGAIQGPGPVADPAPGTGDAYKDQAGVVVPGIGFAFYAVGIVVRSAEQQTYGWARHYTLQLPPDLHYTGEEDPQPVAEGTVSGQISGPVQEIYVQFVANTSMRDISTTPGTFLVQEVQTVEQYTVDLSECVLTEIFYDDPLAGPTRREILTGPGSVGPYAYVSWESVQSFSPGAVARLYSDYAGPAAGSLPRTAARLGMIGNPDAPPSQGVIAVKNPQTQQFEHLPCTYRQYKVGNYFSGVVVGEPSAPNLLPPLPEVVFRGPRLLGRQLTLRPTTLRGARTDLSDLTGLEVWVDGDQVPGSWESWTAYREGEGMTLLLHDGFNVRVVPLLDVGAAFTLTEAEFTALLRHPGADLAQFGAHPGHHSFPLERGFALLDGQTWVAVGPWDAYRDLPADEWRALNLTKPRTRLASARLPLGKLPPARPLALWDVLGTGGDVSTS